MNNIDVFKRLFNEFEELTFNICKNNRLTISEAIKELKDRRISPYSTQYSFIEFCRRLRNSNSHTNNDSEYLIYTDKLIENFKNIIEVIKHPYKVYDKATHPVVGFNENDKVRNVMKKMDELNYTHIPIYDNNKKIVGVFSETAIFKYLYDNEIIQIDNETTFKEIKKYIDLNNSDNIKFVAKNELYDNVINEFISEFKKGSKLSCVMVTEHGKKNEYIIGIITAWDIIGKVD